MIFTAKTRLIALICVAFLSLSNICYATTKIPVDVVCPVCGFKFSGYSIMSCTQVGMDTDFRPRFAGADPLQDSIWTCPRCYYSNDGDFFEKKQEVEKSIKTKILKKLKPLINIEEHNRQNDIPGWVKFDLAATINQWEKRPEVETAGLYLRAAWCTRDEENVKRERAFQRKAIKFFRKALIKHQAEGEEKALITYLVAESYRRLGDKKNAVKWFKKVFENSEINEYVLVTSENALETLGEPFKLPEKKKEEMRKAKIERALSDLLDPEKSAQAAGVLSQLKDPSAVPKIIEALKSKDEDVRWFAAGILGDIGDKRAVPHLEKMLLSDPKEGPRWAAAKALFEIPDESSVPALIKGTGDNYKYVRENCIKALGRIGNPAAIPHIITALKDKEIFIKRTAIETLAKFDDPRIVPALLDTLTDKEQSVRWTVSEALVEFADEPRVIPALIQTLKDESHGVRQFTVAALGTVDNEKVVPEIAALWDDCSEEVFVSLARLTNISFSTQSVYMAEYDKMKEEWNNWWKDNKDKTRKEWLINGFAEKGYRINALQDRSAIPVLLKCLEDQNHGIRYNAVKLLKKLTGQEFGSEYLIDPLDYPRQVEERALAVKQWKEWWSENP